MWGSSISAVPEDGNAGNLQGPGKWLPEKERPLQNRQLLSFCGVPSISAVPEAGNPGNLQGPWKWLPEKERPLQNRQLLGFCGVPSISAVPEAGFPGNPQLLCHVKFCHKIKGLEHILGRSRGGPFSKMWPPLNGHMDSHSSSFSGATHKERPGLTRKG